MAHVHLYAAARAAAGVAVTEISATRLGELLRLLKSNHPELEKVLLGCSYLLNGTACSDLQTVITEEDHIDVLPRFAGG
jgi:molybdopterin converting factor small subunit